VKIADRKVLYNLVLALWLIDFPFSSLQNELAYFILFQNCWFNHCSISTIVFFVAARMDILKLKHLLSLFTYSQSTLRFRFATMQTEKNYIENDTS